MAINTIENSIVKSREVKILHVINIFFSLSYLGNQFKYFSEKGYKQHLVCSFSPYIKEYIKAQSIEYKEVKIIRKVNPLKDINAIYKICRYILRNRINIVIGHTPKAAFLAIISAFVTRVPKRIYFRHGLFYETLHGFPRLLMINIDRFTALCATQVVCVSTYVAERSISDKLFSKNKQIILGKGTCGGIDALGKFNPYLVDNKMVEILRESLGINENDFVVGFCGRLTKDKGIIDLVMAFNLLNKRLPQARIKLLLLGDFDERDYLPQSIIDEIKCNANIIHTGFIYNSIENYYSLMNVFVLPSYREGFGMATLEAASMELPVLTTNITGCKDAIQDGITGFYISNTPDGITSGILRIINDPKPKYYGINGRKMVLQFFDNTILWPIIERELYS